MIPFIAAGNPRFGPRGRPRYFQCDYEMDKEQFKEIILRELASAPSPYQGSIGQAYLDNAWLKGAEYMAQRCVELLETAQDDTR